MAALVAASYLRRALCGKGVLVPILASDRPLDSVRYLLRDDHYLRWIPSDWSTIGKTVMKTLFKVLVRIVGVALFASGAVLITTAPWLVLISPGTYSKVWVFTTTGCRMEYLPDPLPSSLLCTVMILAGGPLIALGLGLLRAASRRRFSLIDLARPTDSV